MPVERVVVVGASGFGRECLDVLEAMRANGRQLEILGVVDDDPTRNLSRLAAQRIQYLGSVEEWARNSAPRSRYVLGIGDPAVRRRITEQLSRAGVQAFTAIHPSATFGANSQVGAGSVICAGVAVSNHVRLGRFVHLNPNATIGHDAVLEEFVSVNPGAVISGGVAIGASVLIGASATVLQNLAVGEGSILGAGSVVTRHVPPHATVKGVPGVWA